MSSQVVRTSVRQEELEVLQADEKLGHILILDVRDNRDGTYTVEYYEVKG